MTVQIRPYTAEDADWLTERHATLYSEAEGFDDSFGPLVASILAQFAADHDPEVEAGWIAQEGAARLGSIFCVRLTPEIAKLRLFLLVPEARGKGLGKALLAKCIGFAKETGYSRLTLWTHKSHRAACALYAANGFACVEEAPVHSFGCDLIEQTWTLEL